MIRTVSVTPDDIARGRCRAGDSCPVALAVNRTLGLDPNLKLVEVDHNTISYACFGEHWAVETPAPVVEFVDWFDARLPVGPFTFDIDVPGSSEEEAR